MAQGVPRDPLVEDLCGLARLTGFKHPDGPNATRSQLARLCSRPTVRDELSGLVRRAKPGDAVKCREERSAAQAAGANSERGLLLLKFSRQMAERRAQVERRRASATAAGQLLQVGPSQARTAAPCPQQQL